MRLLKALIDINFKVAVFVSIFGGFFIYKNPEHFTSDEFLLFGPLGNNLLIVAVLIAVMQLLLLYFYFKDGYKPALAMGLLFILIGFDLQTYADNTQIDVDSTLMFFCFYLGAAHLLFFLAAPDSDVKQ